MKLKKTMAIKMDAYFSPKYNFWPYWQNKLNMVVYDNWIIKGQPKKIQMSYKRIGFLKALKQATDANGSFQKGFYQERGFSEITEMTYHNGLFQIKIKDGIITAVYSPVIVEEVENESVHTEILVPCMTRTAFFPAGSYHHREKMLGIYSDFVTMQNPHDDAFPYMKNGGKLLYATFYPKGKRNYDGVFAYGKNGVDSILKITAEKKNQDLCHRCSLRNIRQCHEISLAFYHFG